MSAARKRISYETDFELDMMPLFGAWVYNDLK
jgi:hypothetical protein